MRRSIIVQVLRAAAPLALASLTGCAPSVRLPAPETTLPLAFEATPAQAAAAVALDRWWLGFNDPQLDALVSAALDRSTTIRMAHARLMEARAARSQARASTLPSGGLSASAGRQGSESLWGGGIAQPVGASYQASFAPAWEVDLFGRLAAIRERADLDRDVASLDFAGVRLALAADVAAGLFDARFLAAQREDAIENLRIARELARTAELGRVRGLTSDQDAARLDADLASAEAELERITAELTVAKRSLLILSGEPTAATSTLAIEPSLSPPPPLPVLAPGTLLARRPDVRSAEIALQAASETIRIDRLVLFPRFNIQPSVGITATGAGAATGLWSIAAGMTAPILDRARLLAALRISEARGHQAVVGYERAIQAAFGEAENALTRVAADKTRTGQLERAAERAEAAFRAARRGYAGGITDLTTLLQAERVWIQNRAALNAGRLGLLTDTVTAIRALGGGWDADAPLASTATLDRKDR